jgi:TonB family protein
MEALLCLIVTLGSTSREPTSVHPIQVLAPAEPKILKHVRPRYPEAAWHAGLDGVVVVECGVDADGEVSTTKVLEGVPPLVAAVVPAVKKWRYSRTLVDGKPIRVSTTVKVTFKHPGQYFISELKASLEHRDEFIREAAAVSLGRLGPRAVDATRALMRATKDESARVRTAASEALGKVRGK